MANNCPNGTNEGQKVEEQVNYTLFTVQEEAFTGEHAMMNTEVTSNKLTSMVKETLGRALLGSGCTKTVVGKDRLATCLDMIDDDNVKKVSEVDEQPVEVLVRHFDDFTFAGTSAWETKVIGSIKNHSTSFKYIGLAVEQRKGEIRISQNDYVAQINPIQLSTPRKKDINEPLTVEQKKDLKALSGQVLWVRNHTRPDMSFESCVMSNAGRKSKVKNIV